MTDLKNRIQRIFDRIGPERDRHTDWTRCTEEPWFSLAGLFRVDGQYPPHKKTVYR